MIPYSQLNIVIKIYDELSKFNNNKLDGNGGSLLIIDTNHVDLKSTDFYEYESRFESGGAIF